MNSTGTGQVIPDTIQLRPRKRKLLVPADDLKLAKEITSDDKSSKKRFKTKLLHLNKYYDFLSLPNELIDHILQYLDVKSITLMRLTCHRIKNILNNNHFWRVYCRKHFPFWNEKWHGCASDACPDELQCRPYIGQDDWKRQFILNYTKGLFYHPLGTSGHRRRNVGAISVNKSAYGYSKMCCSRDHTFALDFANTLHVYRWDGLSDQKYRKVDWLKDFSKNVIDVTTGPKYDNRHRRYVYVLSQSASMRANNRNLPNTRSNGNPQNGVPTSRPRSGDKIDVFDERTCRRVFNMTFDPEMRFTALTLTSETQQKTLFMMTDIGKVYSLQLYEPSLMNLGSEGIQVTLKSASKMLKEKVEKISSSVGIVSFITESGKLYIVCHLPSEHTDLFGHSATVKLGIPQVIWHVTKIVTCSVGERHVGFLDEYNRAFVMGNNRHGQLGTGDRLDRHNPTQVLCRKQIKILLCSLNHTLAVLVFGTHCEMYGSGCGRFGRLPGRNRGCIDFMKLDIKVPWNVRQIVNHKECIFMLRCHDTSEPELFKISPQCDKNNEDDEILEMSTKTMQELLFDMGKSDSLSGKSQVLEAMAERIIKTERALQHQLISDASKETGSSNPNMPQLLASHMKNHDDERTLFRKAAKQLRHEIDRINLDNKILSEKNIASPSKI